MATQELDNGPLQTVATAPIIEKAVPPYDLKSLPDADFIIYTRQNRRFVATYNDYKDYNDYNGWPPILKFTFYVHRGRIAAASPVFSDMLAVGSESHSMDSTLPCVQLFEDAEVIKIMLGMVYNSVDQFILFKSLNWDEVLDVLDAANKYEMPIMADWAVDSLIHSVASASVDDLSKSLTSILKLGDRTLVVRYVKALARLDLKTLKMLDLAQYGTDICLTLLCTRDTAIENSFRALLTNLERPVSEDTKIPKSPIWGDRHPWPTCMTDLLDLFDRRNPYDWEETSYKEWPSPTPYFELSLEGTTHVYTGEIAVVHDMAAGDTDLVLFVQKQRKLQENIWSDGGQTVSLHAYKVQSSRLAAMCPELLKACDHAPVWRVGDLQGVKLQEPAAAVEAILTMVYPELEAHTLRGEKWKTVSRVWQAALRYKVPLLLSHTEDILMIREASVTNAGALLSDATRLNRTALIKHLYHVLSSKPISYTQYEILQELAPSRLLELLEVRETRITDTMWKPMEAIQEGAVKVASTTMWNRRLWDTILLLGLGESASIRLKSPNNSGRDWKSW